MLFFKPPKGYCRYVGVTCSRFKKDPKNPSISYCSRTYQIISKTTPKGDNTIIKAPKWCPKKK